MFGRGPKKSDNSKYNEILGVPKNASQDDLKKACKKAAIKNHPDKGGDLEKFKELVQAYEVLSDPDQRQVYDQYGEMITFPGEAHAAPNTTTGDVVIVLQQKEHPKLKRKGDDLFYEDTLSLMEALCGFQFIFTHFRWQETPHQVSSWRSFKPEQFKAINDEGMPMYQKPFMNGKLYIHFRVEFPFSLKPEQCKTLEAVLPTRSSAQLTDMEVDECEETTLHDVNMKEEMRRKQAQQSQEAYDEDEDMHGGAERVQCAQQ